MYEPRAGTVIATGVLRPVIIAAEVGVVSVTVEVTGAEAPRTADVLRLIGVTGISEVGTAIIKGYFFLAVIFFIGLSAIFLAADFITLPPDVADLREVFFPNLGAAITLPPACELCWKWS